MLDKRPNSLITFLRSVPVLGGLEGHSLENLIDLLEERSFKPGDSMTCLVASIDEQGRFRLSKTGAEAAQEHAEAREYMARAQPRPSGKGFGTLGDLLRDKLKK